MLYMNLSMFINELLNLYTNYRASSRNRFLYADNKKKNNASNWFKVLTERTKQNIAIKIFTYMLKHMLKQLL